jgi:VanZ family protein
LSGASGVSLGPGDLNKARWLVRWWPALVWAAVIFLFSTGAFSAENTSRIILPVLHWIFPHASHAALIAMHNAIRKCGHFTEYFILSLLILRGISAGRREAHVAWALAAVALVAGYAALDELHQSFVPGRGGLEISDVVLDTIGGAAAQAIAALLVLWGHVQQKQREEKIAATDAWK